MMIKTSPSFWAAQPKCSALPSRSSFSFLLALGLIFATASANATLLIQRSITIDGNMGDWTQAPDITTNPGQFSEDAQAVNCDPNNLQLGDDLDCGTVQSTGRDLKKFALTFDNDYLYLYVERFESTSNTTNWLFYLDLDADGSMGLNDKVLGVDWRGSNRRTRVTLYNYVPSASGGDPLAVYNPVVDAVTADGYSMPGTVTGGVSIEETIGGSANGLEMETRVAWNDLMPMAAGPFSIGFHISSSRGVNLPSQVEDNMDGPGGNNALIFTDPFLTKLGPANGVGLSGQPIAFTLTLGNNGPGPATGIEVTDSCTANGFDAFHSADFSAGNYDDSTGIWSVDSLHQGDTATLILRCLIEVEADTELTNTATITALAIADTNTDNNSDSATVTVVPAPVPELTMMKFSVVTWDPVNGSSQPKRIPGAWITYTVRVENSGFGNAETVEITDLLPSAVTLFTGDFAGDGAGPVSFTELNSGLIYKFPDDLELLDAHDKPVTTPNGDFDPAVQRLRISPQGVFWGKAELPNGDDIHEFELQFRVRLD